MSLKFCEKCKIMLTKNTRETSEFTSRFRKRTRKGVLHNKSSFLSQEKSNEF